jgi:oligo-1,6-glucosidase
MGYDISDFEDIYPPFGTMQDMETLISEVHRRGMKIILDLVINHTSDQHVWFQESRKSRDKKYSDVYVWQPPKYDDNGTRRPPNNWRASFGGGAQCMGICARKGRKLPPPLHQGATRPQLGESSGPKSDLGDRNRVLAEKGAWTASALTSQTCTRKTCRSQTQKVTESGTDTQWPFEHCLNGPRIHEFLKEIRRDVLRKYGDDVLMVGECPMTEPDEILRYVSAREKELNMIFDFSMMYVGMGIEDGAMETKAWDLPELKTAVAKAQLLNPA